MRNASFFRWVLPSGTVLSCLLAFGPNVSAQTNVTGPGVALQPIVTVMATDPYAAEPCNALTVIDSGRFTLSRRGATNIDLLVYFTLGGTASNGTDYISIPNSVTIPKGAFSADVNVYPRMDNLIEGTETVILRLQPIACVAIWPPPPECYLAGQPAEAVVFIRDCTPSNLPPVAEMVKPQPGMLFQAPANIGILVDTFDRDGYVGKVEFFEGANKIGEQSKYFLVPPLPGTHIPYEMMWSNVPPGRYVLTARATDNAGAIGISAPVPVTVVSNVPPPYTNLPPVVTIYATDPVAIEGTNCWGWPSVTNRFPVGTTNYTVLSANSLTRIWWFTNCGPKNATFTVRRASDTNATLLVAYAIGGTATNGVDYDLLPGFVTVPAGERKAEILIVPKEDQHPDPIKTVILKLVPSPVASSILPPYVIGSPSRAAAIIVDSDRPRPITGALPDRTFLLGAEAVDGAWYRIESTTDLQSWAPVATSIAIQGTIHFVDPDAQDLATRFYRAVPLAVPPAP